MRLGDAGAVELADTVYRVVIVEGQQEPVTGPKGVRLADELQRMARVRGEDNRVDVLGFVEERKYAVPTAVGEACWRD